LISHGLSGTSTPNRLGELEPGQTDTDEIAPVLSRHSILRTVVGAEDYDSTVTPIAPLGSPLANAAAAMYPSLDMDTEALASAAPVPSYPAPPQDGPPAAIAGVAPVGVMSNGTGAGSQPSNAFEGALEGFDFGLESFGMDAMSWFSPDWLSVEPMYRDDAMRTGTSA